MTLWTPRSFRRCFGTQNCLVWTLKGSSIFVWQAMTFPQAWTVGGLSSSSKENGVRSWIEFNLSYQSEGTRVVVSNSGLVSLVIKHLELLAMRRERTLLFCLFICMGDWKTIWSHPHFFSIVRICNVIERWVSSSSSSFTTTILFLLQLLLPERARKLTQFC